MFESFEDLKKSAAGPHIGKRLMREGIMKMISPHKKYVEPICGAARMCLAKQASEAEVLNDSDPTVAACLRSLASLSDADGALLLAKSWKSSKTVWKKLSASAPTDAVEQLWKFLYVRAFSPAQLGTSYDQSTSGQTSDIAKRALGARARLSKATFEAGDFSETVKRHDAEDTFFYFDVPSGFDRAKLSEVLKSVKGKFLVACPPGSEEQFSGFQVCKVAQRRTTITEKSELKSEREVAQLLVTNYAAPAHKAFEGTSFEVDDPKLGADVVSVLKRTNGGIHSHMLDRPKSETDLDGQHCHLYMMPGEFASGGYPLFFETLYDGPHRHVLKSPDSEETQEDGAHRHKIRVWSSYDYYYEDVAVYDTEESAGHVHELMVSDTSYSGMHEHALDVDGAQLKSLTPAEYSMLELRKSDDDSSCYYEVPATGSGQRLAAIKARVLKSGSAFLDIWIDNGVKVVGWTLGKSAAPVDLAKAEALAARSSVMGDRFFPSLLAKETRVTELGSLDSNFLLVDGEVDGGKIIHLSDCVVEHGLHTRGSHEYFLTKNAELAGVLDVIFDSDGAWKAKIRKENLVPAVLSPRALAESWMPPEGQSGMPSTLEALVPEELRFWMHKGERALELRAALAGAQFITKDRLAIVNREFRMVEKSLSLFKPKSVPELGADWPIKKLEESSQLSVREHFGLTELDTDGADALFVDLSEQSSADAKASLAKLDASGLDYAAMFRDGPDARALPGAFRFVPEFPEHALEVTKRVFVSSFAIGRTTAVEQVNKTQRDGASVLRSLMKASKSVAAAPPAAPVKKRALEALFPTAHKVALLKTEEERFVLGIVLEPETEDSQGDVYSAEEVRKAAHDYMSSYQNIGLQHEEIINGKAQIVESYLAPAAFKIDGQSVKKGTWIFGVRVTDDDVWAECKDGQLTGFSIGGSAVRTPEK